jgi:superfamily II DNA/RNA helicase
VGLTGTLGTVKDQDFLQRVYQIDFLIIPPFSEKEFSQIPEHFLYKEFPPIVKHHPSEWADAIRFAVFQEILWERAVLLICSSIQEAKDVHACLHGIKTIKISPYTGEEEIQESKVWLYTGEEAFDHFHLKSGDIVVATNISGRGTDFILKEKVEKNGGLHLILTFLPANRRVEKQNVGRTARQGNRGTFQYIILDASNRTFDQMVEERDQKVEEDFENLENLLEVTLFKEELFQQFCQLLRRLFPADEKFKKSLLMGFVQNRYQSFLEAHQEKESLKEILEKAEHEKCLAQRHSGLKKKIRRISAIEPGKSFGLIIFFTVT